MKKVTLKIEVMAGSDYQFDFVKKIFESYGTATKVFLEGSHKKNEVHYQIDTEYTQSVVIKKQK